MYTGQFEHSVDSRGRLSLPTEFREKLGDCIYLIRGLDGNILVFSSELTEKLNNQISSLLDLGTLEGLKRFMNRPFQALLRQFFPNQFEIIPDGQGRIIVPIPLRKYAGLLDEVTIIGMAHWVEIWDRDRFRQYVPEREISETFLEIIEFPVGTKTEERSSSVI